MKFSVRLLSVLTIAMVVSVQSASFQVAAQGEWKTIKTLTGSANKDTEDFTVPTNYWRIAYTIKAENEQYALFSVFVYPSGETAKYVAFVTLNKSGTDTSYIRAGPGDFWIHVITANLNSWTVEIQTQQ